jgi:hypothetical protein
MFNMLRAAFTLLICVLIVGLYLGWFSFKESAPDPQSNDVNVNVSVNKQKIGNDLQKLEQNVAKRIQDMNNQPQGSGAAVPAGRQPPAPGLSFPPITVQPSGFNTPPNDGQLGPQNWPVGPAQAPGPPGGQPNGQPAGPPSFQFTVPLGAPPPGEGR